MFSVHYYVRHISKFSVNAMNFTSPVCGFNLCVIIIVILHIITDSYYTISLFHSMETHQYIRLHTMDVKW